MHFLFLFPFLHNLYIFFKRIFFFLSKIKNETNFF